MNVAWNNFERLPGSPRDNFEVLWRTLVLGAYGGEGVLREHYNIPGVEFVLVLSRDVEGLGHKGDRIGWQCKFPDDHGPRSSPSAATKSQVAASLGKIKDKGLAKCYICVPHDKLLKQDEEWLEQQQAESQIELQWQRSSDIGRLLDQIPRGRLLSEVWFGQLALSREELKEALQYSISPVKLRYEPELQVQTNIEQELRKATFQAELWKWVKPAEHILHWDGVLIENTINKLKDEAARLRQNINKDGNDIRAAKMVGVDKKVSTIQRLRERQYLVLGKLHEFDVLRRYYSCPIIAVMADAGTGKTCLGISLAEEVTNGRPAGAFFMAKDLRNNDIDSLAKTFKFHGRSANSFEEVLEIFNAVGRIYKCRMPIVIDGLNESDSPKDWKNILQRLRKQIADNYKFVLLIVTLRSGQIAGRNHFKDASHGDCNRRIYLRACLPEEMEQENAILELPRWCGHEMIQRYLGYYKIKSNWAYESNVLWHPLSLSLYCKSINPTRNGWVEVIDQPLSLNSVFREYLLSAAKNIAQSERDVMQTEYDIFAQIIDIGKMMLASGKRDVDISGMGQKWIQQLASEGVGLKRLISEDGKEVFEIAYDALAGYIMAEAWMRLPEQKTKQIINHEMCDDILSALVHLYYERHNRFITEDHKLISTPQLAEIVYTYPESKIDDKIVECVAANAACSRNIIGLWAWRCLKHWQERETKFTLELLDSVLKSAATPGIRDAGWGTLMFDRQETIIDLLWGENITRDEGYYLILCKWILASNVITFRDRSLHLLVEYGRRNPGRFFAAVVESMAINDEYVRIGMAKAGYAVAMSLYADRSLDNWQEMIIDYAEKVAMATLIRNAKNRVWSRQTLGSLVRTVELAKLVATRSLTGVLASIRLPYKVKGSPFKLDGKIAKGELEATRRALHHNFLYYSMPRLVDEPNYHTDSEKYKRALRAIQSRMFQLGYRDEIFEQYDRCIPYEKNEEIGGTRYYYERFGKKYQRIAYEEYASIYKGEVFHHERDDIKWSIDPCVPPKLADCVPFDIPFQIDDCGENIKDWLENASAPNFSAIFQKDFLDDPGEWVLIGGYLVQSLNQRQEFFIFFDGLVIEDRHLNHVRDNVTGICHLREREDYEAYYLEYPWSTQVMYDGCRPLYEQSAKKPQFSGETFKNGDITYSPEILIREYQHEDYCPGAREPHSRFSYVPEPYVALALNLHPSTKDYNWRNDKGELVFRYFQRARDDSRPDDIHYQLAYMRKKELVAYLKAREQTFVLCTFGERQLGREFFKHGMDEARKINHNYKKAQFGELILAIRPEEYQQLDTGSLCRLPRYEINKWERVRYEITELMKWIKLKCTKAGRPFKIILIGDVPLTVFREDEPPSASLVDGGE